LFRSYDDDDPAPRQEHAIPNSTVRLAATHFRYGTVHQQTVVALLVLAYFFLLRVGEYTDTPHKRKKRTVALRKEDVVMLRNDSPINLDAPIEELLTATSVTICLANQKNGEKDQTILHDAAGDPILCPVVAMADLLDKIRGRPMNTPLGSYTDGETHKRAKAEDVRGTLRFAAGQDGLADAGFDLSRIGSHSLRSGGACRLKLAGVDDGIIKKLGRWTSEAYMIYIQPHIAPITRGCAARMASPMRFTNVHVR